MAEKIKERDKTLLERERVRRREGISRERIKCKADEKDQGKSDKEKKKGEINK